MTAFASPPAFAGASLDRASVLRTDERWVGERRRDPQSRAIGVATEAILMAGESAAGPARIEPEVLGASSPAEPVLLGLEHGRALFAVDLEGVAAEEIEKVAPGARLVGVREAGGLLSQSEGGLVAYAAALLNWHRRHPRCAVCGAATRSEEAGHLRRCPGCGATHHPRTDPVVIMLVTGEDRVLLGRQRVWPAGLYSALAGFVEPGESLEAAVAREVREEAGIEVSDPRYVSSQPWPFPGSLMLGFVAAHAGGEAAVGDGELEDVRWFTRAEVTAAVERSGPLWVPPPVAIARRLIDGWLGEAASGEDG